MGYDSLRIAGGAGGVAQRNRPPLVVGQAPLEAGVADREKDLVLELPDQLTTLVGRVDDVDDERRVVELFQRGLDGRRKFGVDENDPGRGVAQLKRDRVGIEARVEPVDHRPRHADREVRLEHRRHVRQHQRDRVVAPDAELLQRRRELPAAAVGLGPGLAPVAVDHRGALGVHRRRAFDEGQRRERRVVGRVTLEIARIGRIGHGAYLPFQIGLRFSIKASSPSRASCESMLQAMRSLA